MPVPRGATPPSNHIPATFTGLAFWSVEYLRLATPPSNHIPAMFTVRQTRPQDGRTAFHCCGAIRAIAFLSSPARRGSLYRPLLFVHPHHRES